MSLEETKALFSLRGCSFQVEEVFRTNPPDDAPAIVERVQTNAIADSCQHLGVPGKMKLEFANDHLMTVEFVPRDPSDYHAAVERELGHRVEVGQHYKLEGPVAVRILDRAGEKVAIWEDLNLSTWLISG
jgi:hypothetical protein